MFKHTPWIAIGVFATALASCGGGGGAAIPVSASPTAPPIQASPTSLAFEATGANFAQTITVTLTGYSGSFTANASLCANIATVAAGASSGTFVVTPTNPGTCAINFSSTNGTSIGVPITVTATQFVGQ